jgi:enediyne biosynthesis protein E4
VHVVHNSSPVPGARPANRGRLALVALVVAAVAVAALAAYALTTGAGPAVPPAALGPPRFVEEAASAGVEHSYDGAYEFFVGGGVAVFDCDDDALPDLFFAGGSSPAGLFGNRSSVGGALRFEHLAGAATDLTNVTGAYPLDIDGDGVMDLAVLRRGENILLRGTGDCRFERANEAWGFDGGSAWTTAFSATWLAADDWPTLAFGNYLDEASTDNNRLCADNRLYRPAAGGGYGPPTALAPGWCSLSILFSDWDRSGRRDLRVSNDRHYYSDYSAGEEQLWNVAGGEPRAYDDADGWQPLRIWGMGIASYDVTGDGMPEYYLTSQGDNKLQSLADGAAQPRYGDIALARGVTAHRPFTGTDVQLPSTAWHPEFADVNNDGWIDLFVTKGNVQVQAGYAAQDPNNLLLGKPDGEFVEGAEEAGIVHFARTRGAALVDLNADGLLDLVEVNRLENVKLWRNVGSGTAGEPDPMGNWLAVRIGQPAGNREAVGSWIQVRLGSRVIEREVVVGGGHASGQAGPIHVGLGSAQQVDVRVIWPDGEDGPWQPAAANQLLVVER